MWEVSRPAFPERFQAAVPEMERLSRWLGVLVRFELGTKVLLQGSGIELTSVQGVEASACGSFCGGIEL
jgi:hypothetical protein